MYPRKYDSLKKIVRINKIVTVNKVILFNMMKNYHIFFLLLLKELFMIILGLSFYMHIQLFSKLVSSKSHNRSKIA